MGANNYKKRIKFKLVEDAVKILKGKATEGVIIDSALQLKSPEEIIQKMHELGVLKNMRGASLFANG